MRSFRIETISLGPNAVQKFVLICYYNITSLGINTDKDIRLISNLVHEISFPIVFIPQFDTYFVFPGKQPDLFYFSLSASPLQLIKLSISSRNSHIEINIGIEFRSTDIASQLQYAFLPPLPPKKTIRVTIKENFSFHSDIRVSDVRVLCSGLRSPVSGTRSNLARKSKRVSKGLQIVGRQ